MFVGHVRFAADGAPEFATGWNETQAPKTRISAEDRPALLTSRGWFDAYSTSSRAEPFTIETCTCGAKKPMSVFRPAHKPPPRAVSQVPGRPLPAAAAGGEAAVVAVAEARVKL
jgi:hypothetical protein